jgi:hypothetical protein
MPEKEPVAHQLPDMKIVSPLERITQITRGIAMISGLDEVQTAHLRRYANMFYRVREIGNDFSQVAIQYRRYSFGHFNKYSKEEQEITITKEDYRGWIERLDAMQKNFIKKYCDKDNKMTLARIEVEQLIEDFTP